MTSSQLAALFTLQLCVILTICFVLGRAVRWIRQPVVIGEMIAGVVLGPSLFGAVAPHLQVHLFPRTGPAMSMLYTLSQLGLVLYMFVMGMEFDGRLIRRNARAAASVSLAGLLTPLAIGSVLALALLARPGEFFAAGVSHVQASLFLGAAIATTAFPMLARIISERGVAGSRLGTLALTSGAVTDAISWILLAVVVSAFHHDPHVALLAIGGGSAYALFLLTGGRRLLRRLASSDPVRGTAGGGVRPSTLIVTLVLVLSASWYTNAVGIHSIFGGFLLGIVMPRGPVVQQLINWIEPMVKNLLLPLFFVYSGLNTSLGLLNSSYLWMITGLLITASVLGKGVACYAAARLNGENPAESLAIGSLMNARGLIELILLNIGLQAGVITPTLFAILVLMAVVTTLMAAPVFDVAVARGALAGESAAGLGPELLPEFEPLVEPGCEQPPARSQGSTHQQGATQSGATAVS